MLRLSNEHAHIQLTNNNVHNNYRLYKHRMNRKEHKY